MKTKFATFEWSIRVPVRDDFDANNPDHVKEAKKEAWQDVHESNGELYGTDEENE